MLFCHRECYSYLTLVLTTASVQLMLRMMMKKVTKITGNRTVNTKTDHKCSFPNPLFNESNEEESVQCGWIKYNCSTSHVNLNSELWGSVKKHKMIIESILGASDPVKLY